MNKTAFNVGFADGVKAAAAGNLGQPRIDISAGAYLNTAGGRSAGKQVPGPVASGPAPGTSFSAPASAAGGDLGTAGAPGTGDRGQAARGTQAETKTASWLSEIFGDDDT